jgi:hypothetical protein
MLTLHKASFIVWVALMTLHFLGHIAESWRLSARDWRRAPRESLQGRLTRTTALVLTLAIGVGLAAAFTPGNHWSTRLPRHQLHRATTKRFREKSPDRSLLTVASPITGGITHEGGVALPDRGQCDVCRRPILDAVCERVGGAAQPVVIWLVGGDLVVAAS